MDDYSKEEVSMIIEKNLLTADVLQNIMKNAVKRLELYNEYEAVEILRILSEEDIVPDSVKDDINKYLALYDHDSVNASETKKEEGKKYTRVIILYLLILILTILCVLLYFKK